MPVESNGHSQGNPRMYELFESQPDIKHDSEDGKSPTVRTWPQFVDFLKVSSQPVQGPWPPHQKPRPDPDHDSSPVAIADPLADESYTPRSER